jgi:hypothetical protein
MARLQIKKLFFSDWILSSLLQRWRCSCKFKNRRIGSRFLMSIIDVQPQPFLFPKLKACKTWFSFSKATDPGGIRSHDP